MSSSLPTNNEVLVVGGTGSIGSAIVHALLDHDHNVTVMSRGIHPHNEEQVLQLAGAAEKQTRLREVNCNVLDRQDCFRCDIVNDSHWPAQFAGIVYAVGHCPPYGFDYAVATPLTELIDTTVWDEFGRHVWGLLNVVKHFLSRLMPHGHIIVISSAITRLTDETCPPWLHAGQYAVAKSAQDELVRWLRRDPNIKQKGVLVHRLAPAAVDTPFHHGCQHQPPVMLSTHDVAQRVLDALHSTAALDEMMLSPQPQIIAG